MKVGKEIRNARKSHVNTVQYRTRENKVWRVCFGWGGGGCFRAQHIHLRNLCFTSVQSASLHPPSGRKVRRVWDRYLMRKRDGDKQMTEGSRLACGTAYLVLSLSTITFHVLNSRWQALWRNGAQKLVNSGHLSWSYMQTTVLLPC
jgi:hypothetical protein